MSYTKLPVTDGVTRYDAVRDDYIQEGIRVASETADIAMSAKGLTLSVIGTSVTEYGGSISTPITGQTLFAAYRSRGAWIWALIMLGWRFQLLGNYGVSGNTVAQIRARFGDVFILNPDIVIIEPGPNSVTAGVTADAQIVDIQWMIQQCVVRGILPVVQTITPVLGDSAAQDAVRDQVNAWITWRAGSFGAAVADVHKVVTGPSGGGTFDTWGGSLSVDNIHQAAPGAFRMGTVLADVLRPFSLRFATPCLVQGDSRNYCTSGFGNTDASTVSEPGWTTQTVLGSGGTYSLIRDRYGANKWQQILIATGANSSQIYRDVPIATRDGINVGDIMQFATEFETDDDWDGITTLTGVTNNFGSEVQFYTAGSVLISRSYSIYRDSEQFGGNPRSGVLLTHPIAVPATTSFVRIVLFKAGGGTIRFRFPTLFKPASIPTGS